MKRRRLVKETSTSKASSSSESLMGELVDNTMVADDLPQVNPGVVLVDGCEAVGRSQNGKWRAKESSNMPPMEDLSLHGPKLEERLQDIDFNDRFPDEILLHIFKYIWRPFDCWESAKVCKRWCVLQACNQLQRRSSHPEGHYPCIVLKKTDRSGRESNCDGLGKTLKLQQVNSEWRLAMDFLKSCKRHTHSLEIRNCTHVSVRGYQLISGFASNLKSIALESCSSIDDPSFNTILERCPNLRSVHLSAVPKLALRGIEKKASKLQALHIRGCRIVTAATVIAVLRGCTNLKSLSLSSMGASHGWDENQIVHGPPLRLQNLELTNTLGITDGFLRALSKRLSNLRKLDLGHCPLLTDAGLEAVIDVCGSHLQKLVLTHCPGISDKSIQELACVASSLQDLSLAGTCFTDDGLRALMESDKLTSKLRNLSLARCKMVTDAGLQHIASRREKLIAFKALDVQGCLKISAFGLKALLKRFDGRRLKLSSEKKGVEISE